MSPLKQLEDFNQTRAGAILQTMTQLAVGVLVPMMLFAINTIVDTRERLILTEGRQQWAEQALKDQTVKLDVQLATMTVKIDKVLDALNTHIVDSNRPNYHLDHAPGQGP